MHSPLLRLSTVRGCDTRFPHLATFVSTCLAALPTVVRFWDIARKLDNYVLYCSKSEPFGNQTLFLPLEYQTSLFQWESEYRPFENWKHLNTKLLSWDFKWFDIQMVSLWAMSYVLDWPLEGPVPKKTRWCAFDWYSNGRAVWYSNGFQKPDCLASNLFLTTWIPN